MEPSNLADFYSNCSRQLDTRRRASNKAMTLKPKTIWEFRVMTKHPIKFKTTYKGHPIQVWRGDDGWRYLVGTVPSRGKPVAGGGGFALFARAAENAKKFVDSWVEV